MSSGNKLECSLKERAQTHSVIRHSQQNKQHLWKETMDYAVLIVYICEDMVTETRQLNCPFFLRDST